MKIYEAQQLIRIINESGVFNEQLNQYKFWLLTKIEPCPFDNITYSEGLDKIDFNFALKKINKAILKGDDE